MKRKFLIGLLALTCACTAFGAVACTTGGNNNTGDNKQPEKDPPNYTPDGPTDNDILTYELNEDESGYIVTGLAEGVTETNIIIPATYKSLPVLEIGFLAFGNCTQLTSVTISEGITVIGNGAFTQCTGLPSFKFPDSITVIGTSAFQNCSSILTMRFNETSKLEEVSANAFQNCSKLTEITLPDSTVKVAEYAFQGCSSLKTVDLGDGVETIGNEAFRGCSKIEKVNLGSSLKEIGSKAFLNCTLITEMHFPLTLERVALGALQGCSGIRKLTLPFIGAEKYDEPVPEDIEDSSSNHTNFGYIFGYQSQREQYELDLPNMETLTITGDSPIGYHAFQSIGQFTDADGTKATGLSTIIITGNVKIIGKGAFAACYNLKTLVLPKSVEFIGRHAIADTMLATQGGNHIFYGGTEDDWDKIDIGEFDDNYGLFGLNSVRQRIIPDPRYFYSEEKPTTSGRYWHYVDGVPRVW